MTERDDRWVLPFRGRAVTQVRVDFAFELIIDDIGAIRISSPATLGWINTADQPDKMMMHPESQDVAAGLALFKVMVGSAVAFKSGQLRVAFGDGHVLKVDPDPHYEAWTVTGPDRMLIVSLPGGGLAVWPTQHD
ncbi:hypothetical protein GCM10027436_15250 [Actinophytocola sediminis]